ncbi:MAG: hypothetical protein E7255_08085 [Lachnospiraceae bacterium]|jgi:hypothetical protein|nr:hypothetical protein [Lachnospiraceae bacterium]
MKHKFYLSEDSSGFPYENNKSKPSMDNEFIKKVEGRDDDLVIEDNTIYEIDRECYERLRRQKRRK